MAVRTSRTPEAEIAGLVASAKKAATDARVAAMVLIDAARRLETVALVAERIQAAAKKVEATP